MIQIFDNCISKKFQDSLEEIFTSKQTPYYCDSNTVRNLKNNRPQFVHSVFDLQGGVTSTSYELILDYFSIIIPEFKTHKLNRIKVNLNLQHQNKILLPHLDLPTPGITYLYYIEDSDGPTIFYKSKFFKQKINPKKGKLVRFPSNMLHSGNVPRKCHRRTCLNIVFEN